MIGAITEDFGGEARSFRVLIAELRAVQKKCGVGPAVIAARLARCVQLKNQNPKASVLELAVLGLGEWNVDDVREPILQGLMGGGMDPNAAGKLVRTWIDERGFKGLVENAALALVCVVAGVEMEDEGEGELTAGPGKTKPATRKAS